MEFKTMSESVCFTDAQEMARKSGLKEKDDFQVYLAVNCWLLYGADLFGQLEMVPIKATIYRHGLVAAVGDAIRVADYIINSLATGDPLPPINSPFLTLSYRCGVESDNHTQVANLLGFLRFLKRFTPYTADWLESESRERFEENLHRIREFEPSNYTVQGLRDVVMAILDDDRLESYCRNGSYTRIKVDDLPSGVAYPNLHSRYQKMQFCASLSPLIWGAGISADAIEEPDDLPAYGRRYQKHWLRDCWNHVSLCRTSFVPKNIKSYRCIGIEEAHRLALQKPLMTEFRGAIKRTTHGVLDLYDQEPNRLAAQYGSTHDTVATIDFSQASDSISEKLVRSVFPDWYLKYADPLRAHYIEVGKRTTVNPLWGTMGSRLTFDVETVLFYGLAIDACRLYNLFVETESRVNLSEVRAYGDDVIIPGEVAELYCDMARSLGWIVNADKSYWYGPYRESCGEEFLYGIRITANYWPREQINEESLVNIIALQHRFHRFYMCNAFLQEVILTLDADITFSTVGSLYCDIWSDDFSPTLAYAPNDFGDKAEYPLSKELPWTREIHAVNVGQWSVPRMTPVEREQVDLALYYAYLSDGPQYDDEYLKSIGVSSRRSIGHFCGNPTDKLATKRC